VAVFKIVVTGPFNSGKTEFVTAASDIPVVETEKNITTEDKGIKAHTTVAMDYGRITVGEHTVHLYGTPGQTRFSFMWEILASEMQGFIVLVDSTDPHSFPEAAELIQQFSGYVEVPYVIAANKSDLEGQVSDADIRKGTRVDENVPVVDSVAIEADSVRNVVGEMVKLLT